ncbi:MAG TPA: cation:proton antiporter [Actinomycetes bacterium]|nr:cation:proton antiporter [Actinomycetes bacterium]
MKLETAFAVIAGVLIVSALAAGLVERAPLSFPMLFLGLGFLVGDRGLELVSIGLDNDVLEVVAVVTLALVLFLDAVNLELTELRRGWLVPFLALGPGTLLVIGLLTGAGMLLLHVPVVLAAFAAGLAVTALNQTLCDCFLEFGQVIAEMTMLLAFVLFGALLSTMLADVPLLPTLALAALAIFVIRPLAVLLVLRLGRAGLSRYASRFIAWFGPRGLNSLLFALLVVQEGVPGGEELLAVIGVVVVMSVVAHGATATPLSSWYARKASRETLAEERASTAAELFAHTPDDVPRVTPAELAERLAGPDPPLVLDVRSRSEYERDGVRIPGSVRVLPDQVAEWAADRLRDQPFVLYCT